MSLDWLPREGEPKDHAMWNEEYFKAEPPCVRYEHRKVVDPEGREIDGLHAAWVTLDNPKQYNSYTTEMVKAVITAFSRASAERSVVAVVFTGAGDRAFCTGGNTKEYAEYYSKRPAEYGAYMDLFNGMVDAILNCKKPTICRINGMRVAGGQEIGMANDIAVAADTALFGQAGPRHGSAPDGGSSDFLPWFLGMEDAMWNCISCELWSAYKMKLKTLLTRVVPVLRRGDEWVRNPLVVTDRYLEDGEIVYGEFKKGKDKEAAQKDMAGLRTDFGLLDKAVNEIVWHFTNLMPGCLIKSIDSIRAKKKFFWDQSKLANRHWLAANMMTEAFLGFNAFNTKKMTGTDVADFIAYRRMLAEGRAFDSDLEEKSLRPPKK